MGPESEQEMCKDIRTSGALGEGPVGLWDWNMESAESDSNGRMKQGPSNALGRPFPSEGDKGQMKASHLGLS